MGYKLLHLLLESGSENVIFDTGISHDRIDKEQSGRGSELLTEIQDFFRLICAAEISGTDRIQGKTTFLPFFCLMIDLVGKVRTVIAVVAGLIG